MDLLIISILGFIYLNIKYLALVIILFFDNSWCCVRAAQRKRNKNTSPRQPSSREVA
jgi:hypothetical protein